MKKFLTEEWAAEYESRLRSTFSKENTPIKLSLTFTECFENAHHLESGEFWHAYKFVDGVLIDVQHGGSLAAAPQSDYVSSASYDFAASLMKGEASIPKALMNKEIKFKGNILKAVKLVDTYSIIQKLKALDGETEW